MGIRLRTRKSNNRCNLLREGRAEHDDPDEQYADQQLGEFFAGNETLLCAPNRAFDRATVFMMEDASFGRG